MSKVIVEEVARKLGGALVLGSEVRSQVDLAMAVRNRLPLSALKGLTLAGISNQEIEQFVIPPANPEAPRRNREQHPDGLRIRLGVSPVLMRIQTLAEETFGDKEKANRWLRRTLADSLAATRRL